MNCAKRCTARQQKYRYVIQDHLGSTRVVYHDDSGNGAVDAGEIIDENHYYAYGMEYAGAAFINSTGYAYKFNDDRAIHAIA